MIGPRTGQALKAHGLVPDLVAPEFIGEGLAQAVQQAGAGRAVLFAARSRREKNCPRYCATRGSAWTSCQRTRPRRLGPKRPRLARLFEQREVDTVLFTSSSMVESTVNALGTDAVRLLSAVTVASIGPITTATAKRLGVEVDVEASVYTIPGLLDTLALRPSNSVET